MWRYDGSRSIPLAVFAVVCLAGAEIGHLVVERLALVSMPALWLPAGVLVAALLTSERRRWVWFVPTACAVMLLSMAVLHGRAPLPSLGASVIFGLEAVAIAWLVRRATDEAFALDRLPHAFALVAAAAVVPIAGGLLAATILAPGGSSSLLFVWRTWWLADTIGIFVAAPLVIAAMSARPAAFAVLRSWKGLEIAVVLAAGLAVTEGVFGGRVGLFFEVPAYILPFLLWPVFRFGPETGSVATFIVSFLALWHATRGDGPLALVTDTDLVLRSQGGIAIAASSVLLLASIVAERKRVAHERGVLVAELQQALAEIKTLRGFIPICAWCHKVRDDAGFWQQLENYLDEKTDATFSHSICPSCHEHERLAIEAHEMSEHVS